MIERIEHGLGRSLDEHERRGWSSLNELPEAIQATARSIPRVIDRVAYLRHVGKASLDDAMMFADQVLAGGADPRTWRVGEVIYFIAPASPTRLLRLDHRRVHRDARRNRRRPLVRDRIVEQAAR